ncbi:MAG: DUF4255 domain-containing protein [Ktedonobacteraceae bacterium]
MATYHAIAAVGDAMLGMLKAACPKEFEADAPQFLLYQPGDFQNPMATGISLYLYAVSINTGVRNLPPRVDATGRRFRPSLPVDLHYLLIPWAKTAEKQQWLLGWCMRLLEDMAILPASLLNHYSSADAPFRPDEAVELVQEPITLQEIVNIWDAFKPNLQTAVPYVVRMVLIDSDIAVDEGAPVQARTSHYSKGVAQ